MTQNITDEQLASLSLTGDRQAFRQLVERHYRSVYRLCRSILRQPEDAEDATQEVFVRVFQALAQFEGRGVFAAWLRRMTVNHCINRTQLRSHKQRTSSCSLELLAEVLPCPFENSPEGSLLRSEDSRRIRTVLEELPARQRAVLGLRLLQELSYEEIAEVMDVPINSVRSWLHRGRARLREALNDLAEC